MSLPYNVGLPSDGTGPASMHAQNSGCLSTGSIAGRPARVAGHLSNLWTSKTLPGQCDSLYTHRQAVTVLFLCQRWQLSCGMLTFNCHDNLLATAFMYYHDSYRQLTYSAIGFYD